jgi:predicted Zn-dependent protease
MSALRFLLLSLALLSSGCSALHQQPNDIYALREKAQAAYVGEQDDKAERLLLGLAREAPNEPETWFTLGNLYARTNRPDQAVDAYQKALMLNSTDAKVWHNLGVVRVRQAWASFIQSYALIKGDDALRAKLDGLIDAMEKLPLEGLSRTQKAAPLPAAAVSAPAATPPDAQR